MKHIRIDGANANPGAPKDWRPSRDGECGALPVRATFDGTRPIKCESAWMPTPQEMDALNNGGCVILTVAGWQVPVSLHVEPLVTSGDRIEVAAGEAACAIANAGGEVTNSEIAKGGSTMSMDAISDFHGTVQGHLTTFRNLIIEECAVVAEIALAKTAASDIRRLVRL